MKKIIGYSLLAVGFISIGAATVGLEYNPLYKRAIVGKDNNERQQITNQYHGYSRALLLAGAAVSVAGFGLVVNRNPFTYSIDDRVVE